MNILSYRGPSGAGGISSSLLTVFEKFALPDDCWWHLSGDALLRRTPDLHRPQVVASIAAHIVQGHRQYSNNFLWPVLNESPEFVRYEQAEHAAYQQLNMAVALNVRSSTLHSYCRSYFIQDYPLALLPSYFAQFGGAEMSVFWHSPWPRTVHPDHVPQLREIAQNLLWSQKLCFHRADYASNFMQFVYTYLNEFHIDWEQQEIYQSQSCVQQLRTRLVVQPVEENSLQLWWNECRPARRMGTVYEADFKFVGKRKLDSISLVSGS